MSEAASYLPIDTNDPTTREKLAIVLNVLTLDQLLQLTAMVIEVSQSFGFGRVYIEIKSGHPHMVGVSDSAVKFPLDLTPEQVENLLRRYKKGPQ